MQLGCVALDIHTDVHETPHGTGQPMEWREGARWGSFPCAALFRHGVPKSYRILNSDMAFQVIMKRYLSKYLGLLKRLTVDGIKIFRHLVCGPPFVHLP